MAEVHGIPCFLRKPSSREALRMTLGRIKARRPKDYDALRVLVRKVVPLSKAEIAASPGTIGECIYEHPKADDPSTWSYGVDRTPCVLKLDESAPADDLPAIIAHELGHAATRLEDLKRRGEVDTDEWRSELAADWYAYRWGFGREISRQRKSRDWRHHGVCPGQGWEIDANGKTYHFRVSRRFVCKLIGVTQSEQILPGLPGTGGTKG